MAKRISTLSPGNLVKLNENGNPTKFRFLQYNHYGKAEVTLMRERLINVNDAGYSYPGSSRDNNLLSYALRLDPVIRPHMINVPLPTLCHGGTTYTGSGSDDTTHYAHLETIYRSCFLLSRSELSYTGSGAEAKYPADGTAFSYLATLTNRIAYLDSDTAKPSDYFIRSTTNNSYYGLRVYKVDTNGYVSQERRQDVTNMAIRPVITINSEILVSDSVDSDGCYTIENPLAAEEYQKVNGVWLRMV